MTYVYFHVYREARRLSGSKLVDLPALMHNNLEDKQHHDSHQRESR